MEPEPEPQPEAEPRGALREHRPAWLQGAASEMFEEQATAGESLVYGAVGDTDYIIEAGAGVDKMRAWSVMDVVAAMRQREPSRAIRVLDIGTGDGKLLWELHRRFGLPWSDLVGVTAEDMRGVKTRPDKEPFDLREAAGGAASDASYIVWNAERLDECPALRGRSFDLIVSWMTFCWLADPLGTLELTFDEFLAPHGLLVAGGIQMLTEQAEVVEDLQFLSALRERLRAEGRRCDVRSPPLNCTASAGLHCLCQARARARASAAAQQLLSSGSGSGSS